MTWPSQKDDSHLLAIAAASDLGCQTVNRALLARVRELEAQAASGRPIELVAGPFPSPLTKAQVEAAAEKLFVTLGGCVGCRLRVFDQKGKDADYDSDDRTLPDVVHLLCSELGVKE